MSHRRRYLALGLLNLAFVLLLVGLASHRSSAPEIGPYSHAYAVLLTTVAAAAVTVDGLLIHPRTARSAARVSARLALLVGALLVALGIAEVGVRSLPRDLATSPAIRTGVASASLFSEHGTLRHTMRPSTTVCYSGPEYDIEVTTNAAGFRDRERLVAPDAGGCRIAVVGDSYVAALEVEPQEAWPAQLEQLLGARQPGLEVLNFGVPAYSPAIYVPLVRDVVLAYTPDILLLNLCANDVYEDHRLARGEATIADGGARLLEGLAARLETHVALYRLGRTRLHAWRQQNRVAYGLRPIFAEPYRPSDRLAFEQTLGQTARAVRLARDAGAEAFVLMIPYGNQVDATEWDLGKPQFGFGAGEVSSNQPQRFAASWLDRRDVPFLDLLPEVQARRAGRLYYREDTHMNPTGHRLVAEILAEHLVGRGCVAP